MNEEHETEKCTNIRERDDSEQFTSKYEYPDRNNYRTMATPILEEFLTPGETEEKQHSNYSDENEPENSVFKVSEKLEETLSFSHINQEIKQNSKKIHLSVDNEVSHSDGFASHLPNNKDIHCCEYQEQATCESWRTDPCTESQTKSYLDEQRFSKLHKPSPILEQKDILSDYHPEPQTDATIPPPQATASLFQSASGGQLTGLLTCKACSQPAYLAERFEADGTVYHTSCFKCYSCLCMLQRGTWNQRGSKYYCNPCHRRIALQTLRH
ncbi:unnamed protein product [Heterobilharzia americana]|nr:unnamed protein product [Heterobilharzia americana]